MLRDGVVGGAVNQVRISHIHTANYDINNISKTHIPRWIFTDPNCYTAGLEPIYTV